MDLQEGAVMIDAFAAKIAVMATPPPGTIEAVIELGKQLITDRTLSGVDKTGQAFTPYSTAKFYVPRESEYYNVAVAAGGRMVRSDNGKAIKGVIFDGGYRQFKEMSGNPSQPNLKVLHIMLDQIGTVVIAPDHGQIVLGNALKRNEIGAYHEHGTPNLPERPWWGVGLIDEEYDQILELIRGKYIAFINESLFSEAT